MQHTHNFLSQLPPVPPGHGHSFPRLDSDLALIFLVLILMFSACTFLLIVGEAITFTVRWLVRMAQRIEPKGRNNE